MDIDFGELKNDTNFTKTISELSVSLQKIDKILDIAVNYKNYENLCVEDKVKFDLFLSYSINSLFWMHTKLQGDITNNNDIKNELCRVKKAIQRNKEIYEWKTLRPVLDKGAAGRFVKHGLYDRNKKKDQNEPPNKKIKKCDDD